MGASRPPGMARTKSAAWAILSASHISSSVASGRPNRRFDAHRAGEQVRPLRHQPDAVPQQLWVELADAGAVDDDLALGDVDEAGDEADEGGLAGAGAADDRQHPTGVDTEARRPRAPSAARPDNGTRRRAVAPTRRP